MGKRDLSGRGQARRHAEHVGLLYAAVKRIFRKRGRKRLGRGGVHQVRIQNADALVLRRQLHQSATVHLTQLGIAVLVKISYYYAHGSPLLYSAASWLSSSAMA